MRRTELFHAKLNIDKLETKKKTYAGQPTKTDTKQDGRRKGKRRIQDPAAKHQLQNKQQIFLDTNSRPGVNTQLEGTSEKKLARFSSSKAKEQVYVNNREKESIHDQYASFRRKNPHDKQPRVRGMYREQQIAANRGLQAANKVQQRKALEDLKKESQKLCSLDNKTYTKKASIQPHCMGPKREYHRPPFGTTSDVLKPASKPSTKVDNSDNVSTISQSSTTSSSIGPPSDIVKQRYQRDASRLFREKNRGFSTFKIG